MRHAEAPGQRQHGQRQHGAARQDGAHGCAHRRGRHVLHDQRERRRAGRSDGPHEAGQRAGDHHVARLRQQPPAKQAQRHCGQDRQREQHRQRPRRQPGDGQHRRRAADCPPHQGKARHRPDDGFALAQRAHQRQAATHRQQRPWHQFRKKDRAQRRAQHGKADPAHALQAGAGQNERAHPQVVRSGKAWRQQRQQGGGHGIGHGQGKNMAVGQVARISGFLGECIGIQSTYWHDHRQRMDEPMHHRKALDNAENPNKCAARRRIAPTRNPRKSR
ncbi:hypothetical protein CBM2613_B160031 [Cupriavidus taiwanensis]|uniref:Uncharacterized protein n=1 Tax=Cupriavidus taiwanensis TaxID=164546 RepID=A0A976G4S4_9BURK|nr:hypothetical protein CBM2613_B160031 [Cupriavidus taiwanensis]